jgi:hypothetical protein
MKEEKSINKIDKKDNRSLGKENNCMNKAANGGLTKNHVKEKTQASGASPTTKKKHEEVASVKESKQSDHESVGEESKEIEYLKVILKNCYKSKRKLLIKPNLPVKWISDLKAKLAKIQSK